MADASLPVILGLGGTTRPRSTGELALRYCPDKLSRAGAHTEIVTAQELQLPMYDPAGGPRALGTQRLIDAAYRADAVLVASPSYHAGVSGLVKNVLDHLEDLRDADPPYLEGRAVGCIVTARGSQAGAPTLLALRSIVHALRGWPTPLGAVINTAAPVFDHADVPVDNGTRDQLDILSHQVGTAATSQSW